MSLDKIVNEERLHEFEELLSEHFPQVTKIDITVNYNIAEDNLDNLINLFRENILWVVKKRSPLSYIILRDSEIRTENKSIIMGVKYSTAKLLQLKGINSLIQKYLRDRMGQDTEIKFENLKIYPKNNNEELVREAVAAYQEKIQAGISESPNPTNTQNSPQPDFKKRTRVAKIKQNDSITGDFLPLSGQLEPNTEVRIRGLIVQNELRETKNGKLLITIDITDKTDSVTVKLFTEKEPYEEKFKGIIRNGNYIAVKGKAQFDEYAKELNIMANEIGTAEAPEEREDNCPEKRVELHLHSSMSMMDGINTVGDYIKRAAKWGHKAIALTDHGVVHAFPEALSVGSAKGVKIIYGVEAYIVDDLGAVVTLGRGQGFKDQYVVFDIETTGLKKETDKITEIGAVRVENGVITETFHSMVNPEQPISAEITKLTGITDDMVKDAPKIDEVLPKFLEFAGDAVLVAHNAKFDVGFIAFNAKNFHREINNTVLDSLELARTLFPNLNKHKLNVIAQHLGIKLENHHRATDDATATAEILLKCMEILEEKGITGIDQINSLAAETGNHKKLRHKHAVILTRTQTGLRNLYELVSESHINYFYKKPRIPKSLFIKFREGLIIGTACEAGELFTAVLDKRPEDYIRGLVEFYDYLEIQPAANSAYLVRGGTLNSIEDIRNINRQIVQLGEKYNKPVIAAGDVHFMDPEDEIYRRIIMHCEGYKDADNQPPLYFRTTQEMLDEFSYLGEEKAREVVITNPNAIADMAENILPVPNGTFPPKIEGAEDELIQSTMERAYELYGNPLPELVQQRLDKELNSIVNNGFSVMYIIARKLVLKSEEDGYLVGSRGSVGSSFVATMSGITEVNPLPPHYLCKNCKYSDFDSETVRAFAGGSGCDMPELNCPNCGTILSKDGHDIPFETFLGFNGDKEPDIDLNFSGEYKQNAHDYTEKLFGAKNVYKAGTIGTVADKTAYGYVRKYCEEKGITLRNAEMNRLKAGCTGIKRTTGQHPGGLVIVPSDKSIYDFCPVQRPANDQSSNIITTHYDFHSSIEGRLLKLDLLGHDVPTIIRMLHDITGQDPRTVDLSDKDVISLFTSTKALGVTPEDINSKTGTLGLPEFGTSFVRNMLCDTLPNSFADLVRISGLSHGTDVWFNNAQELIAQGVATLKEIIPTRDDIMVFLINKGVEKLAAFKIMEQVRKGKGVSDEQAEIMLAANVPMWYIESCRRIKYMFPKGHAVAYVMMTVRIGYYKIHYPYSFYAASFSVKLEDFDYLLMCNGKEPVLKEIERINSLGKTATAKDKGTLTTLELVLEMYCRGLKFVPIDIYKADAAKFKVTPEGIMPPLSSVQGLGASVAQNIVQAREGVEFSSVEDFAKRTKTNKTVIELMKKTGILQGIPDSEQLTLF